MGSLGRASVVPVAAGRRACGLPVQGLGSLDLEVPFENRHQLSERLVNVGDCHFFAEAVRADVAQFADRVGVGVKAVGKKSVLDQPLEQVFQRPGAGRLVDSSLIHFPDDDTPAPCGNESGPFPGKCRRS